MKRIKSSILRIKKYFKKNRSIFKCALIFLSLLAVDVIGCTFMQDNTADVMSSLLAKSGEKYAMHEVNPNDTSVNLCSKYRYAIVQCNYQTDLTGSSQMYYSVSPNEHINPIVFNENGSIAPTLLGAFTNEYSKFDYGFETIDGKKVTEFTDADLNDVFVSEAVAKDIAFNKGIEMEDVVGEDYNVDLYYGDNVSTKSKCKVLGIIDDDSLNTIGQFEGDYFVFSLFGELFQYRVTYASLHTIFPCSEKAANRFIFSNFQQLVKSSNNELYITVSQLSGGEVIHGKLNEQYQVCNLYGTSGKIGLSIVLFIVLFIADAIIFALFIKNANIEYFKDFYTFIFVLFISLSAFLLIGLLVPPLVIGKIALCYLNPVSVVIAFALYIESVAIFMIQTKGFKLFKKTLIFNSLKIDI